jgi:lipoyl(octanoyl) transferase
MARQSALEVRKLGMMPYADALQIQQTLVRQRRDNEVSDVLLLVEHPHVVTLGVNARHRLSNLLVTPAQLSAMGVELHDVTRGGDVTYHGPGQLVGYPILDLRPDRCDVHRYVRDLETVIMRTVSMFGVRSSRIPGLTGVWVADDKLASIGIRLSRWVTSHGFALNVSTDLTYFDLIRPCGIDGKGVTSLSHIAGSRVLCESVESVLIKEFGSVFEYVVNSQGAAL